MSNHRRRFFIPMVIIIVVIATIAVIMWFKPNKAITETIQTRPLNSNNDSTQKLSHIANGIKPAAPSHTRFTTGLENLPRSLQGTDVDGEIIIDENQKLVVTEGLRRLFDYFLSTLGEENEATIYARVESYIRSHTPEPAASQAITIFNEYIAYLKAIPDIQKRYGNLQLQATQNGELDLNMAAQQKQDVAKLRQQHFAQETIAAFFGAEDDYDDYSIAMITMHKDPLLSAEQKAAAQQDYISRMPNNATKANIQQQANLSELITRTEQLKAKGATPDELYNMRRELVGAAAAGRLAQVDKEDANFDQRFNQYQAQKQQLLSQSAGNTQIQSQINQLEQQLFSDTERKRLAGYAAIQQQTSP